MIGKGGAKISRGLFKAPLFEHKQERGQHMALTMCFGVRGAAWSGTGHFMVVFGLVCMLFANTSSSTSCGEVHRLGFTAPLRVSGQLSGGIGSSSLQKKKSEVVAGGTLLVEAPQTKAVQSGLKMAVDDGGSSSHGFLRGAQHKFFTFLRKTAWTGPFGIKKSSSTRVMSQTVCICCCYLFVCDSFESARLCLPVFRPLSLPPLRVLC